jgi:signal transduction histidine kinase
MSPGTTREIGRLERVDLRSGVIVAGGLFVLVALTQVFVFEVPLDLAHPLRQLVMPTLVPLVVLASAAVYCQSGLYRQQRRLTGRQIFTRGLLISAWIGVLCAVLVYATFRLLAVPVSLPVALRRGLVVSQLVFAAWGLAFALPASIDTARMHALEAERLLRERELAQLRRRLEPHFILNTLNAISAVVTSEPSEARRLLACLGDLLSDLHHDHDQMRSLGEELAWMRRYGELLESRYGPALQIEWQIAPDATSVEVPSLLLQPLLENAVTHGALARHQGGRVFISVERHVGSERRGDRVRCCIADNGPGLAPGKRRPGARGLSMVEETLRQRLPTATFELESSSFGTRAIVELAV